MHVTSVKRGNIRAYQSRLVLFWFSLVEKGARVLLANHRAKHCKTNANTFYFQHSIENHFITKFSSGFRSYLGPAALTAVLFLITVDSGFSLESVTVKCGTNAHITNVDAGSIAANTPVSDMKFTNLDTNCYGKKDSFNLIGLCFVLTSAGSFSKQKGKSGKISFMKIPSGFYSHYQIQNSQY